tara:strand:+ start:895 stop:2091 length:1197 start_codon:yes stop_codon:yes gene_type:complete
MNVLSLFDGMSCGRIALDRLGIPVTNYYAAEIDKYAIQVSEANFPDIIRLGDVCDVKATDLPKIDLILAGSPCQGFSFAGKQLAFDDPRSALFFEFVRLLKECNPKYFLLENVRMKKEFLDVITEQVGVEPIMINSSLVSAQNRVRFYWTNIPGIEQPEQRGIVLKDILEPNLESDLSEKAIAYMNRGSEKWSGGKSRAEHYIKHESKKSNCLTANMYKGVPYGVIAIDKPIQVGTAVDINGHDVLKRVYSPDGKSPTVNTCQGGNREPKVITGGAMRGRAYDAEGKRVDRDGSSIAGISDQMLELRKDGKSNTITTVGKDSLVVENEVYWRKLTPVECERLQTVPDDYTNHVSNSQRFKMLGNGWTIETITHIFKNMQILEEGGSIKDKVGQLTLDF